MARFKQDERKQVLEANRQLILDAAAEAFSREGYDGANINRISTSAGFAKGTIYNYFPSKQALMLDLLSATAQNHYEAIAVAVQAADDPSHRLRLFFEAGFAFVAENLAPARVMVNAIYGSNQDFKMHLYQAYLPMFQIVAREILAPGIGRGVFRQVDPGSTANLLMSIYLGIASQVTDEGQFYMGASEVADFALHSLMK